MSVNWLSSQRGVHSRRGEVDRSTAFAVLAVTMFVCTVAGCAYRAAVRRSQLEAYQGEGTITKIKFLPNPGVKIVFAPFSLAHAFAAVYRIDGLPKRPVPYWVDLVVPDPGDQWKTRSGGPIRIGVPGTLKLSAHSAAGEVIFECQWSPEEHGWSLGDGGAAAGYLDHIHKHPRVNETHIYPEDFKVPPANPATLEVAWEPAAGVPNKDAYVRMRSGGTK
jgi:hypothetical protein